jgi:UDP-N-acetyl-D-mannosaminuronic acid dehydrogenase
MPLSYDTPEIFRWTVEKIVVIGPGIVGMPMAALLAHARIREGTDRPANVVVIQRESKTSGWKVPAINAGRSPIGGVEPDLDRIVAEPVAAGLLRASHDYSEASDADVILVCVQTDKKELAPDYGPLMESLDALAQALRGKPTQNIPLIIFESTLAPSTMTTVIRQHFERNGLHEGKDILLGNSPNRVMPGRLVERVAASDKIVAGLHPLTPQLIGRLYRHIVTGGTLHPTNSMTAEVVKTLENAYRDVRIAFAAEIVRYCDAQDLDFYAVREGVNHRIAQTDGASLDPNVVPSGAVLVPTVGVGGHCLPKDGILLWWRKLESGADTSRSLILEARRINDESPSETLRLAERAFGDLAGKSVAVMGASYRFDSEDTRNSPALVLARLLLGKGCSVTLHDPYVKPDDQNLLRFGLERIFTQDFELALRDAEVAFFCTGHRVYVETRGGIAEVAPRLRALIDGANLFHREDFTGTAFGYAGIGRGRRQPSPAFLSFVLEAFQTMERGLSNELLDLIRFLNDRYATEAFNQIDFEEVRRIAGTCVTGCAITKPEPVGHAPSYEGFMPRLSALAAGA